MTFLRPAPIQQKLALILASLLSLASIGGWQQSVGAQPSLPKQPAAGVDLLAGETEYTLGAGDRLNVRVFPVQEFSGDYQVLVDGTLWVPLIGSVQVRGLTLPRLSEILTRQYSQYIRRPVVTVSLTAPRPLKVAIAGEVNSPGSYTLPLEGGQKFPTVTELLRLAGGLTTVADIGQVQIRRAYQGKMLAVTLNLWEILQQGNLANDITLRDGDSIFIPTQTVDLAQTRLLSDATFGLQADQEINIAIIGEVNRPGSYKLIPETLRGEGSTATTKRQPPRLTLAIQQAGGIKPLANIRQIEVRRFNRDGSQQTLAVDLWDLLQTGDIEEDIILQDGDTIIIPVAQDLLANESELQASASFSPAIMRVNVVGEVVRPGVVEIPPNTPLNQAVLAAGGFDKRRANEGVVELIRLNPNGTVTKRNLEIKFEEGINSENNPILKDRDIVIVNRNGLTATTDTLNTFFSPLGSIFAPLNFFRNITGN